jgi:hypothetical protein
MSTRPAPDPAPDPAPAPPAPAPPAPAPDADPGAGFAPLPRTRDAEGRPRRTGVEIELGGLDEAEVALLARDELGGRIEAGPDGALRLEDSALGRLEIYLDTKYRAAAEGPLARSLIELARAVVPVEIVTEPLETERLPALDRLRARLRAAGAEGSRAGILLGFGLHLNPGLPGETAADIVPVARAYALIEDWLRRDDPIDASRRLLPFSDPWPRAFADLLAERAEWDLPAFFDAYLAHNPTRNRGLDLLPIIGHLAPQRALPGNVSARPAWHYRLPDCRIDEAGWTIAREWRRWVAVERLAAEPGLLDRLAADWRDYRRSLTTLRHDWLEHLRGIVARHGLVA